MSHRNAMTGPEFLEAVADQEAANSNDINADTFRDRALQWKNDQLLLASALVELDDCKARLQHIADHAHPAANSGAITPTDKR